MIKDSEVGGKVIGIMIKWLKDHFPRNRVDLWGIIPPYVLEKYEFLLIVLAMIEALS